LLLHERAVKVSLRRATQFVMDDEHGRTQMVGHQHRLCQGLGGRPPRLRPAPRGPNSVSTTTWGDHAGSAVASIIEVLHPLEASPMRRRRPRPASTNFSETQHESRVRIFMVLNTNWSTQSDYHSEPWTPRGTHRMVTQSKRGSL